LLEWSEVGLCLPVPTILSVSPALVLMVDSPPACGVSRLLPLGVYYDAMACRIAIGIEARKLKSTALKLAYILTLCFFRMACWTFYLTASSCASSA
jgi:hypothetical protein